MRHKANISLLLSVLFLPFSLHAEQWVTGHIIDGETETPLEFVQVAVMTEDTSMVNGDITDRDGYFEIHGVEKGPYLLRASFVGYGVQWMNIHVQDERFDAGTLSMQEGVEELDEVTIEAAATIFRSEGDKRIYNVSEMPVAEGGSTIDILENIPSIQIDQEGDISLRGSGNIQVHINGRPTNLSSDDVESVLEQYPSHAVQEIEIITNPSARYDAEGSGGIINIVLKEEKRNGLRGQADASAGTGHKYSGGLNLNYRQNRINVFTNYNYHYRNRWVGNITDRQYKTDFNSPLLYQDHDASRISQTHLVRAGVEYDFTIEHQVRAFGNLNLRNRDQERTFDIRNMQANRELDSLYIRNVEEEQNRTNFEVGAEFFWEPEDDEDRQFHTFVTFSDENQKQTESFDQEFFDASENLVEDKFERHTYDRPREDRQLIAQADYEGPLSRSFDMETGLKSTFRSQKRSQALYQYDFELEEFIYNGEISDEFEYDEDVHAAYMTVKGENGKLNYQTGLRAEYTRTDAYQPEIDNQHKNEYFNLFPSAHLNYELTDNQDIQLSYSRRIRRPGMHSLSPFLNVQDQFNLRRGNLTLEPEFNNNYEISHIRAWEKFNLTSAVFHRETRNALTRVLATHEDGRGITTWDNAATRNATGVEVIKYYEHSNTFDTRLTSEFYHSLIEGDDGEREYRNQSYSYGFSMMNNFRISGWFNLQLTGNYRGPRVIPQGEIKPRYYVDIGLRRRVLDDQGTLSFNVSDVFNTRQFELETENESFSQYRMFERESRIANLSFTYRFSDGSDEF